jgi:hypothetical protein
VTAEEQLQNLSLLGKLNTFAGIDYPDDQDLRARIKSYEMAFQMQTSSPSDGLGKRKARRLKRSMGLDQPETKAFGERCLVARKLVERGVRFVQIFHAAGGGGEWERHSNIKANHEKLSKQVESTGCGAAQGPQTTWSPQ